MPGRSRKGRQRERAATTNHAARATAEGGESFLAWGCRWSTAMRNSFHERAAVLPEWLIHYLTRLWTLTKFFEPVGLLNAVGRVLPSGSKQTLSVSASIS